MSREIQFPCIGRGTARLEQEDTHADDFEQLIHPLFESLDFLTVLRRFGLLPREKRPVLVARDTCILEERLE